MSIFDKEGDNSEMFETRTSPAPAEIAEQELSKDTNALVVRAREMAVTTPQEAEAVGQFLIGVKGLQKRIHAWIDPLVKSAYDTYQEALGKRKDMIGPTEEAEALAKRKLALFDLDQERIRQETQAKFDAERRQAEDAERARIQKEAEKAQEKARKEAEKARLQAEKAQQEALAKGQAERAEQIRLQAEENARIAKEQADQKAQEALEQAQAVHIPQAIAEKATPKTAGVAMSVTWKYEIVNANLIPREYLAVDEKKIGAVGRATKGTLAIPGVRFYADRNIGVTAGTGK